LARNIFKIQDMNMQMLGFGVRCVMFKPEMSTWTKNAGNFQLVTTALSHVFAVQELLATTTKNMDNGKKPSKIPKDLFPEKRSRTLLLFKNIWRRPTRTLTMGKSLPRFPKICSLKKRSQPRKARRRIRKLDRLQCLTHG
jgi:hypothetical protein